MKLDDFLKCRKVRLLTDGYTNLNKGSEYNLVRLEVVISNNAGIEGRYPLDSFEPVLDQVENPLQNIELTPEFEAVEPVLADNSINIQDIGTDILDTNADIKDTPKFKVGDPVYWGLKSRVFKVYRLMTANVLEVELDDVVTAVHKDELCPATLENYGKLCSLFECIDFEQPPKELKGSDLARAMLDKGWKVVNCVCSDSSDKDALSNDECDMIDEFSILGFEGLAHNWRFAVPFDPRTGEPLTQAVLDE